MYPLSFMTTFLSVVVAFSLNENFFDKIVNQRNLSVLRHCVAPTIGIILIQALHEAAHYLVAKKRRIKIGFPVPIPSFQLGIFGCITPLKSFPKNRSDLLDFALSGPLVSVVASVACIVAGTILTTRASPLDIAGFAVLPAQLLRTSCLVGSIIACLGSKMMMVPLAQPLAVHPMFLVGYAGLFAAGLNLLPIFRLDGGRACSAVFGQRVAAIISVSMLLFLFSCALSGKMGTGFSWILLITIFQRREEIPARDEVTDVNKTRLWAFLFSFLLSVSILTPFPGGTSLL
jgi:Zn-dependent protease